MEGDGHVLSFGGRLRSGRWTVAGEDAGAWWSVLVSLHEARHVGLNSNTAWGHLLQAMWLRPGPAETIRTLVGRCVRTHEAFATHSAVTDVLGRRGAPRLDQILGRFPLYRVHFREAAAVGPAAPVGSRWQAVGVECALAACMQADVLSPLLASPLAAFTPSRLGIRDSPDTHLNALLRAGVALWDDFDRAAIAAFGPARWRALRSDGDAEAGEDRELHRLCSAHVRERLRERGFPTLETSTVLDRMPQIVDAIGGPVVVDRDPTTLFDLESLRLRSPLPGRIGEPGPGSMVVARRAGVLRRQFDLCDDPLPPDHEIVVALRARAGDEVILAPVPSPDVLPRAGIASLALSCARDEAFQERWGDALERVGQVTILIDTPFSQSLDALLAGTSGFRYCVESLGAGTGLWTYVCAVDDFPPWILPCRMTRASALLHHTERASGRRPAELSEVVEAPDAVLDAARRIVNEESTVEDES